MSALAAPPVAAQPATSPVAERRVIGLEGAPNFRDLGGYRTSDGHRVRWGEVYRSNKLSALTPADVDRIGQLRIASLIDFRAVDERQAEPDRWQPGFVYQSPKPSIKPVTHVIMAHPESGAGVRLGMRDLYARMPEYYAPEYAAMLHRLAATDQPLVMHCTAGKDRTGLGSAIVLSLLGVPRATIVQDYALTQRLLPAPAVTAGKAGAAIGRMSPAAQAAVFAADPAYIETALQAIDRRYGSVRAYAVNDLGVTPVEISTLRARLLEPGS